MKGFVSVRQFGIVGLVGSVAVVSVACLTIWPSRAVWLLPVGLGLEVLATLWVHGIGAPSLRDVLDGVDGEPALAVVPRRRS